MTTRADQTILLVEDSPEDYEVTVRAFRKANLLNPVFRCQDGEEALDYLYRRGRYVDPTSAPRPGLVLLDLNLPGTDGRQVLAQIKSDAQLRTIPVIVLTTSADERDIESCYRSGANSYVQKPVSLDAFLRSVQLLKSYWFEVAILPRSA
ncbi:MAG TPA: response regulator [Gemmataceae bacterium]|nr:response regulator [Gemmataceae bacterium]